MVEAVFFDGFVIEPGTVAGFPFQAAYHTEFGCTSTRWRQLAFAMLGDEEGRDIPSHVITALLQLNHSPTIITPLPTSLFRSLQELIRLLILRAILRTMPFPITQTTHLRLTPPALPIFPAVLFMHIPRLDPLPTPPSGAVDAVLGGELLELPVPVLLEVDVEEFLHVLEWDVVGGAAFGRHVLRIVD